MTLVTKYSIKKYVKRIIHQQIEKTFNLKKAKVNLKRETWREINFKALGLNAKARLLLNPLDEGFSKEFYLYGFREPLNTFTIFKIIEKEKPRVLDIGSNIGYFPLIELQAGAKNLIAVEPVPLSFDLLCKSLRGFRNVTLLNLAISDKQGTLKLYVSNEFNITSSSRSLITHSRRRILREVRVDAVPISTLTEWYPIDMIRMDVEGHEYRILAGDIPRQIRIICMELHIIRPYNKTQAIRLLQHLYKQGFKTAIVINDMGYWAYPLINYLGLKRTYKIVSILRKKALIEGCNIQPNINLLSFVKKIREGVFHVVLRR